MPMATGPKYAVHSQGGLAYMNMIGSHHCTALISPTDVFHKHHQGAMLSESSLEHLFSQTGHEQIQPVTWLHLLPFE